MANYMMAEALEVAPYLKLTEQNKDQQVINTYRVSPPLPVAPRRVRWSSTFEQMVTVSNLRREFLPGVGGPLDTSPLPGIRVFSEDDGFLLFGGATGAPAELHFRSGPIYQPHTTALPAGTVVTKAAFSKGRRWLFMVFATDLTTVQCWKWDDPTETYIPFHTIPAPNGDVQAIIVTPGNTFVIVQGEFDPVKSFSAHRIEPGDGSTLPEVDVEQPGMLLAVTPDEKLFVYSDKDQPDEPLVAYLFDGEDGFTYHTALTGSEAAARTVLVAPDGRSLVVYGTSASGRDMPLWFDVSDETITPTGGRGYDATTNTFRGTMSADSQTMVAWSGERLVLFTREEMVGGAFTNAADPFGITPTPGSAGFAPVRFSRDGRYVSVKPASGTVAGFFWDGAAYQPCTFAGIALPSTRPHLVFSPDGEFAVMSGNFSTGRGLAFFKRDAGSDTAYTALPTGSYPVAADLPGATATANMDFSPTGTHLVIASASAPFIYIYKRTGDTFARVTTHPALTAAPFSAQFSPDGTYLALGAPFGLWKRGGDNFVALAAPDIPPTTGTGAQVAWAPDGLRIGVVNTNGAWFYRRQNDSLFRLDLIPNMDDVSRANGIAWTPDGAYALVSRGAAGSPVATAPFVRAYRFTGDAYAEETLTGVTPAAANVLGVGVSPLTGFTVLWPSTGATARFYSYETIDGLMAYREVYTTRIPGQQITNPAISPASELLHFTRGTSGEHLVVSTQAPVATLPFDLSVSPASITRVQYGNTGLVVVYQQDDKNGMAIKPKGSDYINFRDIDGTFVTLYDKDELVYRERSFTMHPRDTRITDIQISKTPVSFSYNARPEGAIVPGAVIGRVIYNIFEENYEAVGSIYRDGDMSSLFAYSPWETYFVNVTVNTDGESAIRLYKVISNEEVQLDFEEVDMETVLYGPPAFSNCDTVVVAHGGATPFTMFARVADQLVYREINISDWQSEEFVLAVTFRPDCTGLIVVTPDKIISMEEDPESPGEWGETDEIDKEKDDEEEPDEGDGDDSVDLIDDIVVYQPGGPKNPPVIGEYNPIDRTLNDITYLPYVSVNVTFRTW